MRALPSDADQTTRPSLRRPPVSPAPASAAAAGASAPGSTSRSTSAPERSSPRQRIILPPVTSDRSTRSRRTRASSNLHLSVDAIRNTGPTGWEGADRLDALVTDVHFRSAVAGLRGLGRAGLEVLALGPSRSAAGRWSRYAAGRGVAPEVSRDPAGFVREAVRLAERYGPLVVYPCREETIDV